MIGSVIIKANPVTAWERGTYCAVPDNSPGYADLTFSVISPDERAEGGYWGLVVRLHGRENILKEMFENGLDRHVEAWGEDLGQEFEGTIDEMVLNMPPDRFTINMDGIVNEGWIRADYDGDNEVERSTTITNTESQAQFGTANRVIGGAEIEGLTVADQAMQSIVDLSGFPHPEADIGIASGDMYLEIFCRGYWHTLARTVYNQTADTGTASMSQVASDIIGDRAKVVVAKPSTWDSTLDWEEGDLTDADTVSPTFAFDQTADLEEGDLTDFDSTSGTGLSATMAAAIFGTYGMSVNITDTTNRYGALTGPTSETAVVFEFEIDPNSLTMADGDGFVIAGEPNFYAYVQLEKSGSNYQVHFFYRDDTTFISAADATTISDAPHTIRYVWQASSGAGNDDGFAYGYIDGKLVAAATGIDNDTRSVSSLRFGAVTGLDAGTSGIFYMDNMRWSNDTLAPFASTAAARDGSYGVTVPIIDTTARYVEDTDPSAETEITKEFWLGTEYLTQATDDEFVCAALMDGTTEVGRVILGYDGTNRYLKASVRADGGSYTTTDAFVIPDLYASLVRVVWLASSGSDDGRMYLYWRNELAGSLTGVDNDTHNVDSIRYGAVSGVDSGTSGTIYVDTNRWSDDTVITVTAESGSAEFIATKQIEPNSTTVTKEYDTDRRPADIIKSMAGLGDSGNNRWVSYVRGHDITRAVGREFVLRQAAPTTVQAV